MPVIDLPGAAATARPITVNLPWELRLARQASDEFFRIIKDSALYDRPIEARHRVIFYLGHLDGFDAILICREGLGITLPEPELDALFQAGIDPDSEHLPTDQPSDWPNRDRVQRYVESCRGIVDRYLAQAPAEVVEMAIEHRLMHLETLAYMFHNFGYDRKQAPGFEQPVTSGLNPPNAWISVPEGVATLGKQKGQGFGWDNEFEAHQESVPAFQIQRRSVTNGDYLAFVKQGGEVPNFWIERNGVFHWRGMFAEIPLPLDWPVYVTQQQAQTYAKSIGLKLPTEAQFHRAAYGTPEGVERPYPWGAHPPAAHLGNFDFRLWAPEPVWKNTGQSAFGVDQLVGNAWQWTRTPFMPFDGFQQRPEYPGYSANFFDGEHFVMKGGSPRTAARLLRRSFRNWFRADYPYMYAGFRCVEAK